jgi:thiamine-monophosphate kinase
MVKRAGARPGDAIMVTGTIGDAALGVQLRRGAPWKLPLDDREYLLSRYLLPQPRNALADPLREHASAAMDISDGLAGDLAKLCRVSAVAASVFVRDVPLSSAARAVVAADPAQVVTVVTGGDDYEIVCSVPLDKVASFKRAAADANVPLTQIGMIAQGEGATFIDADNKPMTLSHLSYSHF